VAKRARAQFSRAVGFLLLSGITVSMTLTLDRMGSGAAGQLKRTHTSASQLCSPACEVEGSVHAGVPIASVNDSVPVSITLRVTCHDVAPLTSTRAEIVLLFDYSYSMTNEADYLSPAKDAVRGILGGLNAGDHRVAAIAYKSQATVLSLLTGDFDSVRSKIEALSTNTELASPSIFSALSKVEYVLRGDRRLDVPVVIIIIGEGDLEERDPVSIANELRASGYQLFAIGFTRIQSQIDRLKRIVGRDNHYFSGMDPLLVEAAVRGLLADPPTSEIPKLVLEVVENGQLPLISGSTVPLAVEKPAGIEWERASLRTGEYLARYSVRAIEPGRHSVAQAVVARYEACPSEIVDVPIPVPVVNIAAPPVTIEATPTAWHSTSTSTIEPTERVEFTATPFSSQTVPTNVRGSSTPENIKGNPQPIFLPFILMRTRTPRLQATFSHW